MYQVELVWNREFHFVPHTGPKNTIAEAIIVAKDVEESGDGSRVKKTRIIDEDGKVVWAHGKLVRP